MPEKEIHVRGAREHNLQNIEVRIPRDTLAVITGISGSGKSSLAFDTIYAEGQRRFVESLSAYARQFLGLMEKPDVDSIDGLSPAVSIEQKTTHKNPRSTVGTVTEIYDYLRLLYARIGKPHCHSCGRPMLKQTIQEIVDTVLKYAEGTRLQVLSPIVRGRKGEYKELLRQVAKDGFVRARINGEIKDLDDSITLDRNRKHTIEIIVDRLVAGPGIKQRLTDSVQTAIKYAGGLVVIDVPGGKSELFSELMTCPECNISYGEASPRLFSFNTPYGACPVCNGLGMVKEVDLEKIIPDNNLSIKRGGIKPFGEYKANWLFNQLESIGLKYGFTLSTPIKDISPEGMQVILHGSNETFTVKKEYLGITSSYTLNFEGAIQYIENFGNDSGGQSTKQWADGFMNQHPCPECAGARLKKESLHFKIHGKNIAELALMDLVDLRQWLETVEIAMSSKQQIIGHEILREINNRLDFLLDVGIGYLNLFRPAKSLSGGESQRIRLATQIGSQLTGVLYILDEPSIGLHQRDNQKLIKALQDLRDIGNSVIVVEHDKDTIMAADFVVDIGPGAGMHGGEIMATGTPDEIQKIDTITADYLNGKRFIPIPKIRRPGNGKFIHLFGATGNNLNHVNLSLPLGKLICITGVSGSGKSSLINETLYPILSRHFYHSLQNPLPYVSIDGVAHIDKVIEIDQSPIGRTPRSNPATYTKVFDEIRKLFGTLPEAKIRGYKPGRFSFNVKGGRCEKCKGAGVQTIEMNFLPDVYVLCEDCNGKRYNRETLEVRFKGKSINDVLNMTINQAVMFFENISFIVHKLKTLQDVGLGYITLGQSSTTISGGEAQRVKLAGELAKKDTGNTLYILDEPTTGLHFEDVKVLLGVLDKLVGKGNTVIIIEHNMEVIKVADHIIDIGPEGGSAGGRIICDGTPEQVALNPESRTAPFIMEELKRNIQ